MESTLPKTIPAVGDEIEARILAYSMKPHDIRLTQLSHLEWIHSKWFEEAVNQVQADVVTKYCSGQLSDLCSNCASQTVW